jgi:hypothetical protein
MKNKFSKLSLEQLKELGFECKKLKTQHQKKAQKLNGSSDLFFHCAKAF